MTTEQNIVAYQIDVKLYTGSKMYKKARNATAKTICGALNGAVYLDCNQELLLGFNPINISQENNHTPVYAVMEDGSRELIDTPYFFEFLSRYDLCRILVKLDEDELMLHDQCEEIEDRTQWVQLHIDVNQFVEAFVIKTNDPVNANGRKRECLEFITTENIRYIEHSARHNLNHPTFKGLPGLKKPVLKSGTTSNKAAKSALAISPLKESDSLTKEEPTTTTPVTIW